MTSGELPWAKTIRDPVQKDVRLTKLEVAIIDTKEFQRLRGIRQLGTTYLLYPGALHTRFDHSLGTLAVAERMMVSIADNQDSLRLSEEQKHVVRLAALLHDVTHVPFGHTLEDEAKLFERHDSPQRVERSLGVDSEIGGLIIKSALGADLHAMLLKVLTAKGEEEIKQLSDYAVAADIVGNTICADLLDYLRRDLLFTGLEGEIGTRFFDFMYVPTDGPHANRLVLRSHKWTSQRVRPDIVREVLDLLRLRFRLAQSVYYHHSKMCTSAMISAAVGYSQFSESGKLHNIGDEELLHRLCEEGGPAGQIAQCLSLRRLFKPAYEVGYSQPIITDIKPAKVTELQQLFNKATDAKDARAKMEQELEKEFEFPPGSIILYCPDGRMQLKAAEAKVAWHRAGITKLEEANDGSIKQEVDLIKQSHQSLWKFLILVHPDYTEYKNDIATACEERFGLANELPDTQPTRTRRLVRAMQRAVDKALKEFRASEDAWLEHPRLAEVLWQPSDIATLSSGKAIIVTNPRDVGRLNLHLWLEEVERKWRESKSQDMRVKSESVPGLKARVNEEADYVSGLVRTQRPTVAARETKREPNLANFSAQLQLMEIVFSELIPKRGLFENGSN